MTSGLTQFNSGASAISDADITEFCRRYPVDARAIEAVLASPPMVQVRVIREFRPRNEGEPDYSAALMTFLGICKRSTTGGGAGGGGGFAGGAGNVPSAG